jgi:hypothetical protein
LEDWQDHKLEEIARNLGISKSEAIRQAFNYYLVNNTKRTYKDLSFEARKKVQR